MPRPLIIVATIALVTLGLFATIKPTFPQDIYHSLTQPYRAPLLNPGMSEGNMSEGNRVAGKYIFWLHWGASLEDHKEAVRDVIDLDAHIRHVFDDMGPHQVQYSGFDISDEALDAIRADRRVNAYETVGKVGKPSQVGVTVVLDELPA